MKRRIAVLLILALVFCLAGCKEDEEKKGGKEREVTEAATGEPTATPETTPSNEPTEEITPTPDTPKLPHTELTEGPFFAVGTTMDGTAYVGDREPAFTSGVDFIYLTEDGYTELSESLRKENNIHSESAAYYQNEMLKKLSEQTERFDRGWYYSDKIMPIRNDSAVFSYIRDLKEYNGVVADEMMTGYSFDTKTGAQLSITDVITDTEVLEETIRKSIEEKYGSRNVLLDNWDSVFTQLFDFGHYDWVYGNEGIEYWINMEYLTENLSELHAGTLKVTVHPEIFKEQYVGAYADGLLKEREGKVNPKEAQSPIYEEVLLKLISGVGTMTYDECTLALDMTDLSYTFVSPDDAMEEQPNITFFDPVSGDKIYLLFWPEDETNLNGKQTLSLLYIMPFKINGFVLVTDNYHSTGVEYDVVDRSFPQKEGLPSQRTVTFADIEDALAVLLQGFYLYYPDLFG